MTDRTTPPSSSPTAVDCEYRELPGAAALVLGHASIERPGLLAFLQDAQADGFGINQPGDDALDDEEWASIATTRVNILVNAYRRQAPQSGSGTTP